MLVMSARYNPSRVPWDEGLEMKQTVCFFEFEFAAHRVSRCAFRGF